MVPIYGNSIEFLKGKYKKLLENKRKYGLMKSSFLNDRTWDDLAGGGFSNKPKRGEKMGDALKATAIGAMT